ncbi:hypothetical protein R5R35_003019 [Gryllus longicercus]
MPWEDILVPAPPCYAEDPPYDYVLRKRLQIAHAQASDHNASNIAYEHEQKNRTRRLQTLKTGDLVLLRNMVLSPQQTKKLAPRWIGPYRVTKVRSAVTFDIQELQDGRTVTAHLRNLLLLPSDPTPQPPKVLLEVNIPLTEQEPFGAPLSTDPTRHTDTEPNQNSPPPSETPPTHPPPPKSTDPLRPTDVPRTQNAAPVSETSSTSPLPPQSR